MSILLENTILKTAEAGIEQGVSADNRDNYNRIVVAGMQVALNGGANSPFAKMVHTQHDPIETCVNGAVGLCLAMRSHSKGVMPLKAMVPAAMTLMLKALDMMDKSGLVKVGKPELATATKLFMTTIFKKFNITPQQLAQAAVKVHAIAQNPAAMDKLHYAAGTKPMPGAQVVKPPMAAAKGGANGV